MARLAKPAAQVSWPAISCARKLNLRAYAAAHGRDGAGPVRERYLTDPLDIPDPTQWRTEVCWPLAPAGTQAN